LPKQNQNKEALTKLPIEFGIDHLAEIERSIAENDSVKRYRRHLEGESIEEIAKKDEISVTWAKNAVRKGKTLLETQLQRRTSLLRLQNELAKAQIQRRVHDEVGDDIIGGIKTLCKGNKEVAVYDEKTRRFVKTTIKNDTKTIVAGIEQARKVGSIDERPSPAQTLINVQQQVNTSTDISGTDFEGRLSKIREAQKNRNADVIDVEVQVDPDVDTVIDEEGEDGDWEF
jgi:hypothetical protein